LPDYNSALFLNLKPSSVKPLAGKGVIHSFLLAGFGLGDIMIFKWEKVGNLRIMNFMLIGEYIHTIDEKNRISLPAKFRKEMGKKIIITPGLDKCLFIFNMRAWQKVVQKLSDSGNELSFLKADQRSFNRIMFGQATDVEVDKIGRILLPEILKSKIKVKDKAVVAGIEDRVEIWNERDWQAMKEKNGRQAEELAEKLSNKDNG
jgi:MraZ protein